MDMATSLATGSASHVIPPRSYKHMLGFIVKQSVRRLECDLQQGAQSAACSQRVAASGLQSECYSQRVGVSGLQSEGCC
jgi:hypothetical protein